MDPIREFRFSDEELKADIARATALFVKRVRKDVPAAFGPKLAEAQNAGMASLGETGVREFVSE